MLLPPPALSFCASCAEQTDAILCCARCHTDYCSRVCQKAHWASGGHKKACAGIARARRDTDLEVQSRGLARVAHMSGGAPGDAHCLTCLDGGDAADPLVRGCACRGSSGWSHVRCLIESAEAARAPPPGELRFAPWIFCSTCKQQFAGLVWLRLAIALWAKYAHLAETDMRLLAATLYAAALDDAGEPAETARLQRGILDVETRTLGLEHRDTLISASNLAVSLSKLGECAEAAVLLRTTLAVQTRTLRLHDKSMFATEGHLVNVLLTMGEYVEAEAFCRELLEKRRRVLGTDHCDSLALAANLASSLSQQGKHTEAVEILREVLVKKTRLLGAEHQQTLISAFNLAVSLWRCGQKTEGEKLLRDTLVLSRRVLGPTHAHTLCVLQRLRAVGLAVR